MLRWTLIVAAGCVLLIAVLALTRNMGRPEQASPTEVAEPVVVTPRAAAPVPAKAAAREPEPPSAPVEAVPLEQQVEDDAAAVGMTTREPEEAEPPPPSS